MDILDLLEVAPDDAAKAHTHESSQKRKTRKEDPRFWKPTINNPQEEYQAKIRMLPRGVDGLRNNLPATVEQHVHFIKEPEHGLYLTVKCRKTLGSHEKCPICEYNWSMWHTGIEELREKAMKRKANVSNIGNFYIREDLTNPANNGLVKLWEHTAKTNELLIAPTRVTESGARGFAKKLEKFTPYSPVKGRDFIVLMQKNPKNGFPTYEGSFWDEDGLSDLAPTKEGMLALLEQCHDLREFVEDVPSAEDLATRYSEFCQALEEKTAGRIPAIIGDNKVFTGGVGSAASGATSKAATTGDSASYFAQAPKVEHNELSIPVESTQTTVKKSPFTQKAPVTPIVEEDDIPFKDEVPATRRATSTPVIPDVEEDDGEEDELPF